VTRYRIVPEHSLVVAEARSSLHPIRVETAGLRGFFEADVQNGRFGPGVMPRGHVEIETRQLRTGNALYDGELERRLGVREYPVVGGDVSDVRELDGDRYRVKGEMSFHGVTRPVEGEVRIRSATDHGIEVEGELVFDMRDFGLEPPRLLMLKVHPEVRVRGRVLGEEQNAP